MGQVALVFDFDGVILDSESVKLQAFTSIFDDYPHAIDRISTYNAHHRGVPRIDKIRHICEHILACVDCDAAVDMFLQKYAAALKEALTRTTLIPGILQFLEQMQHPKFVCSSAPQEEVGSIIATRKIDHHFTQVFGYPASKVQVLRQLKQAYRPVIFFGDAIADYQAAQTAHATFIGVVSPITHDRFRGLNVSIVEQFTNTTFIQALVAQLAVQESRQ